MSSRRVIVSMTLGLAALCCCAFAILVGVGALLFYSSATVARLQATATRAAPTRTHAPDGTPPPAPTPGPTEIAGMDAIQQQVIAMRGLQPVGAGVERKFLTTEELKQRTIDDFNRDSPPDEVQDSVHELAALGLLAPNLDLYDLYIRLYSEGIAGFYDPDTKELVLISEAGELNAYEKTVFAHEYNHALQDQNYDVRGMGFSSEGWKSDSEKAAAVQALLEGDSSLLEEQYKATLSRAEQSEYDKVLNSFDLSIYSKVPSYLLQDFAFPYTYGLDFVRRYYDEGGWARVDEVWRRPPVSTEQIIHPERYDAGDGPLVVARPALTDTLGSGWRQIETNVMGEWYTYLILAYGVNPDTRLPDRPARTAAEGWGGDGYTVSYNDTTGQTVVALQWDWDTPADADEFVKAFKTYGNKRFGSAEALANGVCWTKGEVNCFYFNGTHTLWLIAPDQATIDKLLTLYPDF